MIRRRLRQAAVLAAMAAAAAFLVAFWLAVAARAGDALRWVLQWHG